MPVFNKYYYEPLCADDAVRIVVLDPAAGETTPLSCSIIQCRRSAQTMDYIAVSYVWGKPEFSRNLEIRCDGDISYLRITRNVDTLLRRFRASNKPRYLWIDAVCLDQENETEKAQQIPLMGRIYEEAKSIFIWLGPENHMTAMTFAFFRKANRLPEIEKAKMAKRLADLGWKMNRDAGLDSPVSAVLLIVDFFDRPWFSRRWVIQEAYVARQATVYCGNHSIPLPLLITAARRIQTLDMSSYSIAMVANLGKSATKDGILALLWKFHEAGCLEPRDRIAALFGLLAKNDRFPLDYTTHWTELYKQVASFLFGLGEKDTGFQMLLHLFEFGAVSQLEDVSYPSWVPDWSRSRKRVLPFHSDIMNPDTWEQYPTSPKQSENFALTFHRGVLHISWPPSISGPQGRQVIYAKKFDDLPHVEEHKEKRVIGILHNLFPSIPASILQISALSLLLQTVVEFLYTPNERDSNRLDGAAMNVYMTNLSTILSMPLQTTRFDYLRNLDSILQKFCLFQMEPFGLGSESSWGYGIGPEQVQVGDIMIPLWRPESHLGKRILYGHGFLPADQDADVCITTMLAVRPIAVPSYDRDAQSKGKVDQRGRIIGPSVCVTSTQAGGYSQDQRIDTELNNQYTSGWRYSMRLV
ncbi:heterokaryon incompatibility domain-containing protein [Trichoderma afarasin]